MQSPTGPALCAARGGPHGSAGWAGSLPPWRRCSRVPRCAPLPHALRPPATLTPPLPPQVLARGEKIELLVDKTEALNQSAKKFQKASKSLKSAMWWKNVKMWLMIAFVLAIVAFLIWGFACGFKSPCQGRG